MRSIYLLCLSIFLFAATSITYAQSFEITPFSGYTFGNSVNIPGGKARIGPGHTFGGLVGFSVSDVLGFELLYSRQHSRITAQSDDLTEDVRSEGAVTYILGGSNRRLPIVPDVFDVFGGAKLGAVVFSSRDKEFTTDTRFAVGGTVGMNYFFSEVIGLRIGANVYFPVVNAGASLWWGGGGPQVGLTSWSPLIQFNLLGGITFRL